MSIYFPDSLFEIAGNAVNELKEPISWSWSVSNVMDWVQYGLRLPQYVIIFKENNIDGKKLIFINCQTLPSMHITDFDHIKDISSLLAFVYHFIYLLPTTDTGAHTQHIERLWGSAKWGNKKRRGTNRNCLESYLAEFMWRTRLGEQDAFETILKDISEFWPPL